MIWVLGVDFYHVSPTLFGMYALWTSGQATALTQTGQNTILCLDAQVEKNKNKNHN